jgi:hypothetical protein
VNKESWGGCSKWLDLGWDREVGVLIPYKNRDFFLRYSRIWEAASFFQQSRWCSETDHPVGTQQSAWGLHLFRGRGGWMQCVSQYSEISNIFSPVALQPKSGLGRLFFEGFIWHSIRHTHTYTRPGGLYLIKHNTHNREKSMPSAGSEPAIPASERTQTHALGRAANGYLGNQILLRDT